MEIDEKTAAHLDDHQLFSNIKTPTRRRYQDAFSPEEEEVHIVPQPTVELQNKRDEDMDVKNDKELEGGGGLSCQVPSCVMTFDTLADYQKHYNTRHMHSCCICKKSLPSSHILELHVLEVHDTLFSLMAEKKPMYSCFLESCPNKFATPEERRQHCLKDHSFPQSFHYWDCKPPKKVNGKNDKDKKSQKKSNLGKQQVGGSSKLSALLNGKSDKSARGMETESANHDQLSEVGMQDEEPDKTKFHKGKSTKPKNNADMESNTRTVPKHIAFGHAPHRAFRNAYTTAIDPTKNTKQGGVGDINTEIDMKDVEEALVTSSEAGGIKI